MTFEERFTDLVPALTKADAVAAASACLYCADAPCTKACPTHIDVPAFIRKISTDNLKGAARVILSANVLGGSCARVCPVEELCEGACVQNRLRHEPVRIARLQRYATDAAISHEWKLFEKGPMNGRKVACVGAGPASLSAAFVLAQKGYAVTVYDERELPGGLDTYAMADYKLKIPAAQAEIETLKDLGVTFVMKTTVGRDVPFAELEAKSDAIFLGIGLGGTARLGIPGEGEPGVVDALSFIEKLKTAPYAQSAFSGEVLVIGAGNTAIDAVTQSKRLGAKSATIVYRRGEEDMPCFDYEYELAKKDGCRFEFGARPKRIERSGDRLALVCEREGREVSFLGDRIIRAIGQAKRREMFDTLGIALDDQGRVLVDSASQRTSNPRYFAGGDCVNGGQEAVNAVAAGKRAAAGIDATFALRQVA